MPELALSMLYEKMMYKFYLRLDKLCSFLLLFLALLVVNQGGVVVAAFIAAVTAFQLVYSPGQKGQSAKSQYCKYLKLYHRQEQGLITEEEIKNKLIKLSKTDSDTVDSLYHPARLASLAIQGIHNESLDENEKERPLKWNEKLAVWFAGEYPEFRF
ncbi:hypothetical protein [Advenella sp. EE-W14]|uniref:hypothetical protein n=1 Tax=Advenella sp. EE-W14 TaxID=2722705 RepID=UPI00145E9642|nr:hypothetical protein [Advenella sp. EE-W14]